MHRRGFLATTAVACLARGVPVAAALSRQIKITGLELASHGGGATNMLAMPNAIYIESGSVKNTSQKMIHGEILGPSEPGMSSELDHSYIARYKVG